MKKPLAVLFYFFILTGCQTVRQNDLNTWVGAPVSALDEQPVFLTMPVIKTTSADGTEIRNYINGRNVSSCIGSMSGETVSLESYTIFTNCMSSFAACNNIFYIKNGHITQYVPVGTGGARCYTDERARPNFRAATNFN